MSTSVTLARNIDYHTFSNTRWYVDFNDFLALYNAFTMTVSTLVLNDSSLTITYVTGSLGLHHTKDTLLCTDFNARTMTVLASLCSASLLSTRAMTVFARNVFTHLKLLGNARSNLLQRQTNLQTKVCSTVLRGLMSATSEAAKSSAMSTEHIAKHREDIVHRETTSSTEGTTTKATARSIETKLVILLAFLWIVQYIISLSSLFKLCFSLRVIRITVRMILDSKFSVCFLYFVFRGILADT